MQTTIENSQRDFLQKPSDAILFQAAILLLELADNSENCEGENLETCLEARRIAQTLMNNIITS